ncbi:MAG: hypothetical protein IPN65_08165 [Elusimicrobia bacterium]|nr:hypothetical protein [Elusimicrobiota bacterium]MBK7208617.1 hypothetical protein [Elusimicrobiota bacterium]MBK7545361.1 hypothetical protein [Elusimicrobiota bacterium]MBK7575622.1 hypothetical protein [Elusimicrobiota bacterium]MBK7688532.1 hypothetical protein [Elusimicrobiota bacterium]
MKRLALSLLLALTSACVAPTRVATRAGTDFSRVQTVLLLDSATASRAVTDAFARALLDKGYRVRVGGPDNGSADLWMEAAVTQFTPDRKYLVPLQGNGGIVLYPVQEISGRSLYPSPTAASLPDAQVVISNAAVSLSVRLLEPRTGDLLWTGAVTYEGLDMDAAVEGSVASLLKRFPLKGAP